MNLYELTDEYQKALDNLIIDEETGEITNFDDLEKVSKDLDIKFENIACYIKNLNAEVKALKEEEENLNKRRKSKDKKIENLENYLSNIMQFLNKDKFESARAKISFRKSESVDICSALEEVEERFITREEVIKVDKTKIKEALKKGEELPYAQIITKQNIQIK